MGSQVEIPEPRAGTLVATLDLKGHDLTFAIEKLKLAAAELQRRRAGSAQSNASHLASSVADSFSQILLDSEHITNPASPALPYQSASSAPPPAVAPSTTAWTECYATDPSDHDHQPISGIAYADSLPGLPGGEGHAGWLVSSSQNLLQLWECSRSGGRGEPALMMMHSQATDCAPSGLEMELQTKMLLGVCVDRASNEFAAFHSLGIDTLLAQRGKVPMPHVPKSKLPGRNCLCVSSLHSFGGPLAAHVAASYGGGIAIWEAGTAQMPAKPTAPRAVWKAHDALITALHATPHSLHLYSSDAGGTIKQWFMRAKPSEPSAVFYHDARVTGIHQVNDQEIITTGADGRLLVWDIRIVEHPQRVAVLPGPISNLAVSSIGDSAVVSTGNAIYCVDLLDPGCHVSPVVTELPSAVTALQWNTATEEVVAGTADGRLRVYRRNFY